MLAQAAERRKNKAQGGSRKSDHGQTLSRDRRPWCRIIQSDPAAASTGCRGFPAVGTWLSLVEHSLGVRGVGSSNLPVPTIYSLETCNPRGRLILLFFTLQPSIRGERMNQTFGVTGSSPAPRPRPFSVNNA